MDTQRVELTQIVTLILKTSSSCPTGDEGVSDTNRARLVEKLQARLTTVLDRFMQELGDPVRFREEHELPIYGIWRRRRADVISKVVAEEPPPRYPTEWEHFAMEQEWF